MPLSPTASLVLGGLAVLGCGGSGGPNAEPAVSGGSSGVAGSPGASGAAAAGGTAGSGGGAGAGQGAGAGIGGVSGVAGFVGSAGGRAGQGGMGGSGGVAGRAATGGSAAGNSSSGAGGAGATSAGGMAGNIGVSGSANAAGMAGNGNAAGSGGAPSVCTGTPSESVSVYMIGDSTMSVYASDLYPRMGWGQPLQDLFAMKCAVIVDKALSGRSSKSFYDEGAWTPVKNALGSGDYVLIQFAHNDEKSDDATRYTEPQTTYKQYLTMYVNDARAKGATPLLLTPINRNNWSGTKLSDSHGTYPPAMRELAVSLSVELIDLTALTKAYFERIGQAETAKLFMVLAAGQFPNYPNGNTDNTHLQEVGARMIGRLAVSEAYAQGLRLATFLVAPPVAP